jgi:hypothetical protein
MAICSATMAPNAVAGYRYSSKSRPSKGVLLCVLAWSFVVVEYWVELLGLPVAFYALRYDIIFLYDLGTRGIGHTPEHSPNGGITQVLSRVHNYSD